jgi:hypothetical protein
MADFKLNFDSWGIEVTGGKIAEVTDGVEEMKQRIAIAIKTQLGEWFLDTTRGVPYLEEWFVKVPKLGQLTSRLRAYLMTVEGVVGVDELVLTLDQATRTINVKVDAVTTEGITGPFNVSVTQ